MSVAGAAGKRPHFLIDYEAGTKRCPRCMHTKGLEDYYAYTCGKTGERRYGSWCKTCQRRNQERIHARQRGSAEPRRRSNRFDDRGRIWCPNCRKHCERSDFREHPNRPGKFWSYCIPCTRELDRIRYRYTDKDERRRRDEESAARKRKRRSREMAERRRFVQEAIGLLRRRGFTQADIGRLVRADAGNLLAWERGERKVHPAIAETFGAALIATREYATAPEGAAVKRGGRPHRDTALLLDRMETLTAGIRRKQPVRWRAG